MKVLMLLYSILTGNCIGIINIIDSIIVFSKDENEHERNTINMMNVAEKN